MDEWPSMSATALMCTPASSQPTAARVPQGVYADTFDTRSLGRVFDDAQEVARVHWSPEFGGEHQPRLLPLVACAQLLGLLLGSVLAQHRHDGGGLAMTAHSLQIAVVDVLAADAEHAHGDDVVDRGRDAETSGVLQLAFAVVAGVDAVADVSWH